MSSEALDKTVITFGKFFRKKLFQHFIHHKKILKVTKFQFKISVVQELVLNKNIPLRYIVLPSPVLIGLNMPLINCEVQLILNWLKNCVLISKSTRDADYDEPIDRKIDSPENAIFQITDTKLYVSVVTLSKENDIKLSEQLKTELKEL